MEREQRQHASRRRREEREWERERVERNRSSSQDSGYEQSYHSEDDGKPAALPESVAVDDNRSQNSELGYHSSEAHSDGGYINQTMSNHSSTRSAGSVGSHGSGGGGFRLAYHGPTGHALHSASIMNGETRFPFAISSPYPGSEAAKSDIATVCSGSVTEDIDMASVTSGGEGSQTNAVIMPSPSVERVEASIVMVGGGNFRRQGSGGRVEFAADSFTLPTPRLTAAHLNRQHIPQSSPHHSSEPQSLAMMNDMGPPLSRALLDQSAIGESSRAGSVRSFGSNAGKSDNSDVAAQVDTDDCGGSLNESVTDGHSIHSQEDVRIDGEEKVAKKGECDEPHPLLRDGVSKEHPNGRTSPGGTIYKGKGVRRYLGRYMNLPLKRFHQNGVTMGSNAMDPDADYYSYTEGYDNRRYSPSPPRATGYRSPEARNGFAHGNCRNGRNGFRRNSHSPEDHSNGYPPRHNGFRSKPATNNGTPPDRRTGYAQRRRSRSRSRSRSPSPRRSRNRTDSRSPSGHIHGRRRSRPRESPSNISKPRQSPRRTGRDSTGGPNQDPPTRTPGSPTHHKNRQRHNSGNNSGRGKTR
jgi:hypothetical protein